jgi:hypothetical protein
MSEKEPNISEKPAKNKFSQFIDESKESINKAKALGLISEAEGDLFDLLNKVVSGALESNQTEEMKLLVSSLESLRDLAQDESVQLKIPFFGIYVSEDNDGLAVFTFAD